MSQSSRHKALRPVRERERLAWALPWAGVPLYADGRRVSAGLFDGRATFDVHAATEHALGLVALDNEFAGLGQRILDMLDGERGRPESLWLHAPCQPSECQGERCETARRHGRGRYPTCPDCNGTGRNLRGVLPAVEWSAPVRRKVRDSGAQCGPGIDANPHRRDDDGLAAWVGGITDALDDIGMVAPDQPWYTLRRHCGTLDLRTRVVPRGSPGWGPYRWAPRGSGPWIKDGEYQRAWALMPGWRRGQLKHADKRIARAAERRGAA